MSAATHIEKAIHALSSSLGASGELPTPGSREAKARWYCRQALECLKDLEVVEVDPTLEVDDTSADGPAPSISEVAEGAAPVEESPKSTVASGVGPTTKADLSKKLNS